MLWFNLNFEGESTAEVDFRTNKCEIWISTCELARLVIDKYGFVQTNHKDILTHKWWNYQRFSGFAEQMKAKFEEDPSHMNTIRGLFASQKDKLSYYNLFQFIEHDL